MGMLRQEPKQGRDRTKIRRGLFASGGVPAFVGPIGQICLDRISFRDNFAPIRFEIAREDSMKFRTIIGAAAVGLAFGAQASAQEDIVIAVAGPITGQLATIG